MMGVSIVGAVFFPPLLYFAVPAAVFTKNQVQQFFILKPEGKIVETANKTSYQIGGPLCFAGDFLAHNIELPEVRPKDCLLVSDIGANTFSLYSRHCSLPFPKVIAYAPSSNTCFCLKEKESFQDIIQFWS